jgi:glycosyltransferase involved in cell wall biosynthesis
VKPKIGIASTDWSQSLVDSLGHPIPGGAGWVRLQQVRPKLQFESVTGLLIHHPTKGFAIADYGGTVHFDLQVIIMQRLMFGKLIEAIAEVKSAHPNLVIINDVDDWYWGLSEANAAYEITKPDVNPDENIEHYKGILQASDVVTVSTPFLHDKMTHWLSHPNVIQIENGITPSHFNVRRMRSRKPIIGWVGSTSHRSNDLEELQGALDPSWRYHHSGHVPGSPLAAKAMGIDPSRMTTSPMLPPLEYARRSFQFDIGLAPLSDIPFNHAKSWIKLLEYSAAGVPFVASPAPEYLRLKDEYGIGRIAHSKDEWREHIIELMHDKTRVKEAKQQRELVKRLDVNRMARDWNALLNDVTQ